MSIMNITHYTTLPSNVTHVLQEGSLNNIVAGQIVQEKSFAYVVGEQVVRPLIDRILTVISRVFSTARNLDKYLSFPSVEAASADGMSDILENVFSEILKDLKEEYKNSSNEMKSAFESFKKSVENKKGLESINANEDIRKLESAVDLELRSGLAFSTLYVKIFKSAADHILKVQHNKNEEERNLLITILNSKINELEFRTKIFNAILNKKHSEISNLKEQLNLAVEHNKQLIDQNKALRIFAYFLEGKLALKDGNIPDVASALIGMYTTGKREL